MNWTLVRRVIGGVFAVSGLAMAAAAMTSASDKHVVGEGKAQPPDDKFHAKSEDEPKPSPMPEQQPA